MLAFFEFSAKFIMVIMKEFVMLKALFEDRHYALFTPNHLKNWLRYVGFRSIKVNYCIYKKHILKQHLPFIKLLTIFSKKFSRILRLRQ